MENNFNNIKDRDWNSKTFATPKIPRGKNGMIHTIDLILEAVKNKVSMTENIEVEDTTANCKLDYLCIRLRPIGLVIQKYGVWELTKEGEEYLSSKNKTFLARIFCANIKFFSEMLFYLKNEVTSNDLFEIATNQYKLGWKTKSDINNRLIWLREFELINYNDYKLTYQLNEKGLSFLEEIKYIKPEELTYGDDITIDIEDVAIGEVGRVVLSDFEEIINERKETIGYIPGNISEFIETISEYIQLMYNGIDIKDVYDFSEKTYNIAKSSTGSFISTLTSMKLIDHKSRNKIQASNNAIKWNETKEPIDLLCWIHSKFKFFFEILEELNGNSFSNKELASIAKTFYGFSNESIDEIRKRIKMLLINNLIMEDSINTYTITQKGKKLLAKVPLQKKFGIVNEKEKDSAMDNSDLEVILQELRMSSRDSVNPSRFEKSLKSAFELLGFEAILMGGPGKTDVLLKTHTTHRFSYIIAIEAKTSSSGSVSENVIDFDTIKEHKKKHSADYNVIVAPNFQGERVIERAKEHGVLLLDIDALESILKDNASIPLSFDSYKKLFEQIGIADINVLSQERKKVKRQGLLMQAIMDCLIDESDDLYTEGILTERDIYRSLRELTDFDNINPKEIQLMLDFLSSPLIGCVAHSKEGYYAIESLNNISKKFEFYSNACR